jgi:hypothetical protein
MLKKRSIKYFFSNFIPEEELELFARWAFGFDFLDFVEVIEFRDSWNLLHGETLKLEPDGLIHEDALKMRDLWEQRNK